MTKSKEPLEIQNMRNLFFDTILEWNKIWKFKNLSIFKQEEFLIRKKHKNSNCFRIIFSKKEDPNVFLWFEISHFSSIKEEYTPSWNFSVYLAVPGTSLRIYEKRKNEIKNIPFLKEIYDSMEANICDGKEKNHTYKQINIESEQGIIDKMEEIITDFNKTNKITLNIDEKEDLYKQGVNQTVDLLNSEELNKESILVINYKDCVKIELQMSDFDKLDWDVKTELPSSIFKFSKANSVYLPSFIWELVRDKIPFHFLKKSDS